MLIYFKKNMKYVVLLILTALIHNLFLMRIQFIKGEILDIAVSGTTEKIFGMILMFVFFLIVQMFFQQVSVTTRVRMTANITKEIKNRLFESMSNRHISSIDELEKSAVITRYTTDIQMIESNYLSMGGRLFEFAMIILTAGISLVLIDYKIALLTLVVFLVPMFITNALKSTISKAESDYITVNQRHIDKLLKYLKGLEAIKNYSIEREIEAHYTKSLDEVTAADVKRAFKRSLANGMSFFSTMISQAAILIYSSYLLYIGELSAGTFVTVFSLVLLLRPPFYWISQLYESVIASRPAIRSVHDMIHENRAFSAENQVQHNVVNPEAANEGEIDICDMSYAYKDGKPIFERFNLHIKSGEKVLISGPSGSGKTTLINLIIGRLLPDAGRITLGSQFSYFKQEAFMFNASIHDNLTMFRSDFDETKIAQVARSCGLEEMYLSNKEISESGANLSGGEKKRISLARTMLDDQKIRILDEPFANIDPENIDAIEDAIIRDNTHTMVIISHIVSDRLRDAIDRVIDITDCDEKGEDIEKISEAE